MAWTLERVYLSGGVWTEGVVIPTQGMTFSQKTMEAGTASFFVPGETCALNSLDRVFIYGPSDIVGALGADMGMSYTSQYPPDTTATYVKATTEVSASYDAPQACDPAQDLLDGPSTHEWYSAPLSTPFNQRFHIDLGSAKVVKRVYYENSHNSGANTNRGVRAFTMWGSNTAASFADLAYANDAGWTLLATAVAEFDQHVAADALDPKYFLVTNSVAYRYYAFKFSTNWGESPGYIAVRRIELQIEGWGTAFTLAAAGSIPAANFLVQIDNEKILCAARSGTAVSGCTRGVMGTTTALHASGAVVQVLCTWGGIVYSKVRQGRSGFSYSCLDFTDHLEGLHIEQSFVGQTDVQILTTILALLKSTAPNLALVSTGVTPTTILEVEFDGSAQDVLNKLCELTGNKFYVNQPAPLTSPILRYFTPSLAASGIVIHSHDAPANWSWEECRAPLANRVKVTATIDDAPKTDNWVNLETGALGCGGPVMFPRSSFFFGRVAGVQGCGFRFYSPRACTSFTLGYVITKTGSPNLYCYVKGSDGVAHGPLALSIAGMPAYPNAGVLITTLISGYGPEVGWFYVSIINQSPSDTNYFWWHINELTAIEPCGFGEHLTNAVNTQVYDVGAVQRNTDVPLSYLISNGLVTGWTAANCIVMDHPSGGMVVVKNINAAASIHRHFTAVNAANYLGLHIEYDETMRSGYIMDPGNCIEVRLSSTAGVVYRIIYPADCEKLLLLGANTGWITASGAMDWTDINTITLTLAGGDVVRFRNLHFEGQEYSKDLLDATAQYSPDEKYFEQSVGFQNLAQVDSYAAALLLLKKTIGKAWELPTNDLYMPIPYTTVDIQVGGESATSPILGYEINCLLNQTKLLCDAYSTNNLEVLMASIGK